MRMADLLNRKKAGQALTDAEIAYFVSGFTAGDIPDYQASALLMAICLRGMTDQETAALTDCMARSGDLLTLSSLHGPTVDKHSTGGVGDKTTLIVAPLAAACGLQVAKMSGRGLGHTGGTIDKLESIPGFRTALSTDAFLRQVERIGVAVTGQTGNLAPADKALYALRDATETVDSVALIAASVMSKKLAAGAAHIVLDVKCGSGAFMETQADARRLAQLMVEIGKRCGRKMAALVTDMDAPLGTYIGNALEVREAMEILQGRGDRALRDLSLALTAQLLQLGFGISAEKARETAAQKLSCGAAFEKFLELVAAQGGSAQALENGTALPKAKCSRDVFAKQDGCLFAMQTRAVGECAQILGAGRAKKGDAIDPAAGLILHKKPGDFCRRGEPLATLYAADEARLDAGEARFFAALAFRQDAPQNTRPLVLETIC